MSSFSNDRIITRFPISISDNLFIPTKVGEQESHLITNFGRLNLKFKMVFFHYADRMLKIKKKKILRGFIARIFKKEKIKLVRLDYIFCSDSFLLKINQSHLHHNFYTDIVTFDLSEYEKQIIGEIYISLDRIKENAFKFKTSYKNELYRVIFHGALHLCGYKDKTSKDILVMREKEDYYLNAFSRFT
jgi:probable rRNA maturation factor